MNTFGTNIRLTTFGESHGPAMGGILDGMPSLISIDKERIQREVDLRSPGRSQLTSQRKEPDRVEILSGISSSGLTLGSPIGFIIRNVDHRPEDYKGYDGFFRPNHADYTYYRKYGIHEFSGGGRSSARETVSWVTAGAICRQWLEKYGIEVSADFKETNSVNEVREKGDSTGGIVEGEIRGLPIGLGSPVFDKFHARLAAAMMGINAAKAFEYGDGFESAYSLGSKVQDMIIPTDDKDKGDFTFGSNHSGGVQGGITNGMPVNFKVYFKPTPTFMSPMEGYNKSGEKIVVPPKGRHDPCVAIRAVPVVEAMALLTVADFMSSAGR